MSKLLKNDSHHSMSMHNMSMHNSQLYAHSYLTTLKVAKSMHNPPTGGIGGGKRKEEKKREEKKIPLRNRFIVPAYENWHRDG